MKPLRQRSASARTRSTFLKAWGAPPRSSVGARPEGLGELREPPECLFLWGRLPPFPWVSIVGTRRPSRQGAHDAFVLARRLARHGITVASGGAFGIDSAAHLGALAGRGKTVVVAPTSLPYAYPKNNHRLFAAILRAGGAYLTCADEEVRPLKFAFFRRNEILMALSHATVLGECPAQSGAKNAMLHARKLGRARFALPFRFADLRARGTSTEILQDGAELVWDESPILHFLEEFGSFEGELPRMVQSEASGRASTADLSREEGLVLAAIRKEAFTVDAICSRSGLAADAVQHAVLLLTLGGRIAEDEQGLLRVLEESRRPQCDALGGD